MSNPLWTANISMASPRYDQWVKILGGSAVPLKSVQVYRSQLGEEKGVRTYELDVAALKPEQRERLIDFICERFNASRVQVEEQLDIVGFPIRECDVSVAWRTAAFI